MERVVGGVGIEGDDAVPARDAPDALSGEEIADTLGVGLDLLGFSQSVGPEFEAVECALTREGFATAFPAARFAEEVAKLVFD